MNKGGQLYDNFREDGGSSVVAKKPKKNYEEWGGNNRFYCGGLIMTGPDRRSYLMSFTMISIPSLLWFIFIAPDMIARTHVAVAIVAALGTVASLSFLTFLFCSDPGIIPRESAGPLGVEDYYRKPPRMQDAFVNGQPIKLKFCDTCKIYRPPRASHCSICDNCVERFDHHCPWVGNCVGKRNYRFFCMFLYTTASLCIYTFVMCVLHLVLIGYDLQSERGMSAADALYASIGASPMSFILVVYGFLILWFVGGLSLFHSYLICSNQTTYEQIKNTFAKGNPYEKGSARNCTAVFCSPCEPSKLRLRENVRSREEPGKEIEMLYTPPTSSAAGSGGDKSKGQGAGAGVGPTKAGPSGFQNVI